jgi:shikimate kinase
VTLVRSNIVLIGFMATGKTVVGELVAAQLGRPFIDTDTVIERRGGRPVPRIFAE